MKFSKVLALGMAAAMTLTSAAGCGSKQDPAAPSNAEKPAEKSDASAPSEDGDISGEITVLTQRTDLADTAFPEYVKKFNEKYPNIKVKVQGITDYHGEVKMRMNTEDYGDVLVLPDGVDQAELPNFFEPIGTVEEINAKYRPMEAKTGVDGKIYGIAPVFTINGVVYNKKVFADAGINALPKTPDEFLAALKQIKEKTKAIPLYTNYVAGWPFNQWEDTRLNVSGDPDYMNKILDMDEPFAEGTAHYQIYKLLYDVANQGLIEEDPLTTDWESSKQMMADGEIATMVLGVWAVPQVAALADNPDDIGIMPFPTTAADGKQYVRVSPDLPLMVNKNSKNKEAAMAWFWWFINESGFAENEVCIPPAIDGAFPAALKPVEESGAVFFVEAPTTPGKEGLVDKIDQTGEVGFWTQDFKYRLVESAIGNRPETFEDIMKDLNTRWQKGKKQVLGQ